MGPWDISSLGIQILNFSGTRPKTNNYVEKIICVRHFPTQFVEKIIYVEQLNEFIECKLRCLPNTGSYEADDVQRCAEPRIGQYRGTICDFW